MLIPTKLSINGMIIASKRNNVIKAFENYNQENIADDKRETNEKKYEEAYTTYLEALDKYVLDSIYKKVRNNQASEFEREALSKYYSVVQLKEAEYVEYKYRKQKYLLELDNENVVTTAKEKIIPKYQKFYISKMDTLYKGILKNYSIKLADTTNVYDASKEWIYTKVFYTLEEYIQNILSLKIKLQGNEKYKDIVEDYEKYEKFTIGKLDTRDTIEKNMVLLGISRKLFTHSLPLVVAEQCYLKLLNDARTLVQDTKIAMKREKAFAMLMNLIEDYNIKLLSGKVYWENAKEREKFKQFWNKFKEIEKLKETDFLEYVKQKEILFIKDDLSKVYGTTRDYTKIIRYYKRKLVDYEAMREIKNSYKSEGNYKKVKGKIKLKEVV
jgi:hypothetical protein